MSFVWLGSWYQSHFDFLHYHCLKTCLKAVGFFPWLVFVIFCTDLCLLLHKKKLACSYGIFYITWLTLDYILFLPRWKYLGCKDRHLLSVNKQKLLRFVTINKTFLFIVKIKLKIEGKNWGWSRSVLGLTCFRAYLTVNEQLYFPFYIFRTGLTII